MAILKLKDGTELFYERYGTKNTDVILMIHGFSGRHAEFTHQIEPFVAAGYQVIQVDLRNHGRSSYDAGATIARLSADVNELIVSLGVERISLLAHSMGSAVVWSYCHLFGTKQVKQIITIDESPQCLATNDWPYSLFGTTWQTIEHVMDRFKETKMTVKRLPNDTFSAIKDDQAAYPFDVVGNQALLMNHVSLSWQNVIADLEVPQLYIAGGDSPLWSSEHAEYCANLTPWGQKVIVPGTGHLPHAEDPEVFNDAVLKFLNENK